METFNIKLAKSTIRFLTNNLNHLKKIKIENFEEKCFIYVLTNKSIFNISISDKIIVEIDNNQDRYNKYFYNETFKYDSVNEFKLLFNEIVIKSTKKDDEGLTLKYKGRIYPIFIELSDIDSDRGMGVEKIYDLNIYDSKGDELFVAQVSEYPIGSFNLVHTFENFEISEIEIINYFMDRY